MEVQTSILDIFKDGSTTGVAHKNKSLKRSLINYLDERGNSTITELTQAFNISIPKTTSLVNELIQDGLIKDFGKIDSTGGRRASMYGLVPDSAFFIGVDIKRYYVNIGLLDFKKNLIMVKERIAYSLENSQNSYQLLIQLIQDFIESLPIEKEKILSVGINLSGRINNTTGYSFSFFHFEEEPLSETIERDLGIRTFLENDARANAYGEIAVTAQAKEKDILYIYLDYGIGMGVYLNGKLYYGKSGYAGELGHIPLFNNENICHCGKKGCLETEASGMALINLFKQKLKEGSTSSLLNKFKKQEEIRLRDIVEAAKNDDVLSIELIAAIGEKIGRALAIVINIFNPHQVILGGTLSETDDLIRLPIKTALHKYSLNLVNSDTQLSTSGLGEKAGVIGACLIARNKLLNNNFVS